MREKNRAWLSACTTFRLAASKTVANRRLICSSILSIYDGNTYEEMLENLLRQIYARVHAMRPLQGFYSRRQGLAEISDGSELTPLPLRDLVFDQRFHRTAKQQLRL